MGLFRTGGTEYSAGGRRLDGNSFQSISGGDQDATKYRVIAARFDYENRLLNLWVDGVEVASLTTFSDGGVNTSDTDSLKVTLGYSAAGQSVPNRFHGGRFRYLAGFDYYLSDAEFQSVLSYIQNTYGD